MNKKIIKLKNYINNGNTLLGIGPMSLNTVNAAVEIANESDIPIMLIASRRQIDSDKINRGYVNNWSTEEFVNYIKINSKKDNIILARDHGGPWQNNFEVFNNYSLKDAMKSSIDSFQTDIDSGFDILHIDPSIDIFEQISSDEIFIRLIELYSACSSYADKCQKDIEFEIGTEEQMIYFNNKNAYVNMLNNINKMFSNYNLKNPLFVVTQIGTKVMEMENIGILNQNNNAFSYIKELINECLNHKYFIKVHNTDYLKRNILKIFPEYKISAANVAPEFGVCETKAFVHLLEQYKLDNLLNEFCELAYNSKKWEKWVINKSALSKIDKAVIAGHYIFSNDEFLKIKDKLQMKIKDFSVDDYLKEKVKSNILEYLELFNKNKILKEELTCINS